MMRNEFWNFDGECYCMPWCNQYKTNPRNEVYPCLGGWLRNGLSKL